ncbi:MAG: hypothetical protein V4675_18405 [Verrucomicrobiota bacterium]
MPFDAIGAADLADVAVGAGVEAGLGVVFALETVLDDLELEGADRAEEGEALGAAGDEEGLDDAFLEELGEAFAEALELGGVGALQAGEDAPRVGEEDVFAGAGVDDLQVALELS